MTDNANEKPGCLGILLKFFGLSKKTGTLETLPYRLRDDFLSPAELSFFKVLSSLVGAHSTIQSKVRLADLFFVARPNENKGFFNRIAQRHLDFLVCDTATMKPLLGIELDDSSHKRTTRQERDEFVNQVFSTADLPLVRVPAQRAYKASEITALIAPFMKFERENIAPQILAEEKNLAGEQVICTKCGIPMVLRTVAKGEHRGKQFYGCQNFPRCREMRPIPA